jgi:lipoprotein
MRKHQLLLFAAMVLTGLTGCSSDDPANPFDPQKDEWKVCDNDLAYLESLTRGDASATFECTGYTRLDYDFDNENRWIDNTDEILYGYECLTPHIITINDGRTWTPLSLFRECGPSCVYDLLEFYKEMTGFSKEFYVAAPLEYNRQENKISIDGAWYDLAGISRKNLYISSTHEYYKSNVSDEGFHKAGMNRDRHSYQITDLQLPNLENALWYDSAMEAKLAIIDMLRQQYGDVIRFADYTDKPYFSPDGTIDLNELEERVRKGAF